MSFDIGRVRHLAEQMHRSEDDAGDPIPEDFLLASAGDSGMKWIDPADIVPPGPPGVGIHKILVQRTTNFTSGASNDSVPDYDTVIEDTMTDSWWDVGNASGFEVTADYDGLNAVFMAKGALADPGSSTYLECKMYYFPAASGRDRPISSSTDEDYLLAVEQQPAHDNVNHFIHAQSDPITVGTGDLIYVAWRTSNAQTVIPYNGRVSITLGAYIVSSGDSGGGGGTPSDATPLIEDGTGDAGVSDDYSRGDHVHPTTASDDTPLVESGSGSAGTSDETSRSDHVHPDAGSSGGHYEVMMDGGSPPAPLENGSGTDWLYVFVP